MAIADYNTAIGMDPNLADAYYNRGISFYELERFDDSIADLTRAIDLNPDADHYYAQRSLAYLFTDRMELAQADEDMCEEIRNRG
jgi:tetratricopeptide (TPR) repeat protein